jgi:hypothetical protein
MPHHHVEYAAITEGDKLVALNARSGMAIYGDVSSVIKKEDKLSIKFGEPTKAVFSQEDAKDFSFYKIDTPITRGKLLFFGCEQGDKLTVTVKNEKREVVFHGLSTETVAFKKKDNPAVNVNVTEIYMVRNHSSAGRGLESFINSKGFKEDDCFTFTETDGTVRMGKLVKGDKGLEIETDVADVELNWSFVEKMEKLDSEEYEARTKRQGRSTSPYSPAIKVGDNVRAAEAAYGKADSEGAGITRNLNVQGADSLDLYTRFFKRTGLWVSSRKDVIYEIETDDGFRGKIYGLMLSAKIEDALKDTDLHFYRSNINNPRILIADTIFPVRVKIMLDSKMKYIERIKVTNLKIHGDWVENGGVIMKRLSGGK